jgi:uncharacterized SAM-dependent methyltransferase
MQFTIFTGIKTSMSQDVRVVNLDKKKFERASQIADYVDGLRSRFLPFKFAYIGQAAKTHDELAKSPDYQFSDIESSLIKNKLADEMPSLFTEENLTVIDIGSGNGIKGGLIISQMVSRNKAIDYVAVDYSKSLLEIAISNLSKIASDFTPVSLILDFEDDDFPSNFSREILALGSHRSTKLILLLGHTLGNPSNRIQTLSNLEAIMQVGDILVLGMDTYSEENENLILQSYQNEAFYKAIFNPLSFCGIERADGSINVSFDKGSKDVKVEFELSSNIEVFTDPTTPEICFSAREKIVIGTSHRFTLQEIGEMLSTCNLNLIKNIKDESNPYVLTIASKA